jgi:hypothetical protein
MKAVRGFKKHTKMQAAYLVSLKKLELLPY